MAKKIYELANELDEALAALQPIKLAYEQAATDYSKAVERLDTVQGELDTAVMQARLNAPSASAWGRAQLRKRAVDVPVKEA